jgi:hypothetical protein
MGSPGTTGTTATYKAETAQSVQRWATTGQPVFDSRQADVRFFSSPRRPGRLWAHTESYSMGKGSSLHVGKTAGEWSYTFTPPYVFMKQYLIN